MAPHVAELVWAISGRGLGALPDAHSYLEEKREALAKLAAEIARIVGGVEGEREAA